MCGSSFFFFFFITFTHNLSSCCFYLTVFLVSHFSHSSPISLFLKPHLYFCYELIPSNTFCLVHTSHSCLLAWADQPDPCGSLQPSTHNLSILYPFFLLIPIECSAVDCCALHRESTVNKYSNHIIMSFVNRFLFLINRYCC